MKNRKILLLGLCLLLALASTAVASPGDNDLGVGRLSRTRGIKIGSPGIQFVSHSDAPTTSEKGANLAKGRVYYDEEDGLVVYNGSNFIACSAAGVTADTIFSNAAWTVTVDDYDVIFTLATSKNLLVNAYASTTTACGLEINDNTGGTFTDGILFTAMNSIVDAIDAKAANIDNAINCGPNTILGTTAVIDFTLFDVAATGAITVINSADVVGLTIAPTTATAVAIDVSDTDIDHAIAIGDNTIDGGAAVIDFTYFDVSAAGVLTLSGANADIAVNSDKFTVDAANGNTVVAGTLDVGGTSGLVGDVTITGDLTVSGTTNVGLGTWLTDNVAASTTGGTLTLNGEGSSGGGVTIGNTSTGGVLIARALTITYDIDIDGGDITCPDDLTITPTGGDVVITDDTASKPVLLLLDTTNDANGPGITFQKDRGAGQTDDAAVGTILFLGDDSAQTNTTEWVKLLAEVSESNDTDEAGKYSISVMMDPGTPALKEMFMVEGQAASAAGEGQMIFNNDSMDVDITIETDNDATFFVIDGGASTLTMISTQTGVLLGMTADSVTTGSVASISADGLSSGEGLKIDSTSTAADGYSLLLVTSSGAAATKTRTGAEIAMSGTGATTTNIALSLDVTGAVTNDALRILRGNVLIGDATYDAGTLVFKDGAQDDETFTMSMANGGDFTLATSSGNLILDISDDVDISSASLAIDAGEYLGLAGLATLEEACLIYQNSAVEIFCNEYNAADFTATGVIINGTLEQTGNVDMNGDIVGAGPTTYITGMVKVVQDHGATGADTLTIQESGSIHTNAGDSDTLVLTLPEASTALGVEYTFIVMAAFAMRVDPATDDAILPTCAANAYIGSSSVGDTITIVCIDGTNWMITSETPADGDWISE